MRLTLADPYFVQKIIQKYFVSDAGSSEAVDFVYYDSRGQGMEQTLSQTHLLLQLFFRFQTVYAGKLVSGGNLRLMEQMVTHVLPGISVGTFARMRSVLKKMREEAVRVKEQSGQKAEVFFKESVSLLTFLKGRTDLLTERETWIRLAGESGGAKAASLMEQYFLDKEQQLSDGITSNDGVSEKELLPVLQKIVTDNRSQVSLLLQKAKDDPVYRTYTALRILSERSPKEFIRLLEQAGVTEIPEFQGILKEAGLPQSENTRSEEGILSYDTVTLLFRDTKSYRNEWEQLATLTGQRLGPEAERQLRREYESQITEENYFLQEENHFSREVNYFPQEGNNQTSVENASPHATLRMLAERSPKEFTELLKESGITAIPEFQEILKEAGQSQKKNIRGIRAGIGAETDLVEKNTAAEVWSAEESALLYDTVTLLFRDTDTHRKEWEQLAILIGQRLGPEAEGQLRREYESQIVEENYFLQEENHFSREVNHFPQEGNNQTFVENAPHAPLRMLVERSPKEFTELLKEAGITAIPKFQEILEEAGRLQKKNIREITAGIGAETDLVEKNTAAEIWSAEESLLLYDTVTLLFRDTDTHRKEWEQLAILTCQRLGPEAERQLRRAYESRIVEISSTTASNIQAEEKETPISADAQELSQEGNNQTSVENAPHATLRMLAERSPKEFTELLKEAGITSIPEFQEILKEAGQSQKKNIRGITAGIGTETDLLEKNTAAEVWSAEESPLLYDTVTLLFRDTKSYRKEWEQLAILTGQRLGPKAERQLRRAYESRIVEISSTTASNIQAVGKETPIATGVQELSQEGNNQTSVENASPHATLRKLAERSPKEFTELLKEAGITAIPEFQRILKEAGQSQKKNIRGITIGTGAETDLVEKNTAAEVWSAAESILLYDTVTLLFRDTDTHRKEWEQLATLTGQRLGPEAERQLRREYESQIVEENYFSREVNFFPQEGNNQTSVENAPHVLHAPLRKLAERSPKEFTELLKEAGITAIPEFQGILKESSQSQRESPLFYDTVSLLLRGEYGNRLNVIKGAGERSSVGETGGNMPPSHLQLLQGKRQKGQEQEETRGRLQKLEEQIQIQQKEVIRLTEGQHTSMKTPMPDVNALTRQVMQNLERELRLEKMRKGLL